MPKKGKTLFFFSHCQFWSMNFQYFIDNKTSFYMKDWAPTQWKYVFFLNYDKLIESKLRCIIKFNSKSMQYEWQKKSLMVKAKI
jgi:hypothetical protein